MGWPQYTYLALTILGLGILIEKHGQPKTGEHNFWFSLGVSLFVYFLLYSGGFFGGK